MIYKWIAIISLLIFTACEQGSSTASDTEEHFDYSNEKGTLVDGVPVGYWLDVKIEYPYPDGTVMTHEYNLKETDLLQFFENGTLIQLGLINDTLNADTTMVMFSTDSQTFTWFNSKGQSEIDYRFSGDTLITQFEEVYIKYSIPYDGAVPPVGWGV